MHFDSHWQLLSKYNNGDWHALNFWPNFGEAYFLSQRVVGGFFWLKTCIETFCIRIRSSNFVTYEAQKCDKILLNDVCFDKISAIFGKMLNNLLDRRGALFIGWSSVQHYCRDGFAKYEQNHSMHSEDIHQKSCSDFFLSTTPFCQQTHHHLLRA